MATISINLIVPQGWHELDDKQLRYVYSLITINDKSKNSLRTIFNINPKQKVTFKFLANKIPNPRTLFVIRGKRYVCEKITATFTSNGMSQLLKGAFYPIVD